MAGTHLEGLLHLATLTSVMTLAYLGVDKVGDSARARLEAEFQSKLDELSGNIVKADIIQHGETVNRLRHIVGKDEHKPMCLLLELAKINHDLYDIRGGVWERQSHKFELFRSFGCFLNHWDMRIITVAAAICVLKMFYLVHCATWELSVHDSLATAAFVFDAAVVVLVVWAAHGVSTAKQRLITKYGAWQLEFDRWWEHFVQQKMNSAAQAADRPIDRPAPQ